MAESQKANTTEFTAQQKPEPNMKECAVQQLQKTESYFNRTIDNRAIDIYLL